MHTCTACDTLTRTERLWHGLYLRWYDADRAGRKVRAAVYGWLADAVIARS
ncbi:hypothetical protein [Ornithinimicrobium cerasi]|uniref:hypothetical protein n=1 Tax=Ornithinimicrobium cerasi TaxID=2248773 RepID=UPI00137B7CA9|nr:hypothetical protein [Ornithinimicrobium cerasi]